MKNTYKPTGKTSFLYVPVFVLTLVITAAAAFSCSFFVCLSPSTLLDSTIFFAVTGGVVRLGSLGCVKLGRVRNGFIASFSGLIISLWYWYILIMFYPPSKEIITDRSLELFINKSPAQLLQLFRPSNIIGIFNEIRSVGVTVTGKRGDIFFDMPGAIGIVALAILFIGVTSYNVLLFKQRSGYPFFEDSGKWAKEVVIICGCPEDEELFLSKLLLGDEKALLDLRPQRKENENDSGYKLSIFVNATADKFYVSVIQMKAVKKKKNKTIFKETLLVQYLETDRYSGDMLLRFSPRRLEA